MGLDTNLTALAADVDQLRREKCRRSLIDFSQRVYPWYIPAKHHIYCAEILQRAMNREPGYTKIVVHEPPQHGKSLEFSTLFPAYYIGHNPHDQIIITAYGDIHAQGFSRDIRNIIIDESYQEVFDSIELAADSKAKHRWNLNKPHRGSLIAAGINGAITGKGAKLLIIDDPYKDRKDAESELYRAQVIETYKSTLKTRMHKDCIVIVVMTRWHENDLAGYLLDENQSHEKFMYINLPALAKEDDVLDRRKYEALWPERFPQRMLRETKESVGVYNWSAMYQGDPSPPGGTKFKRDGFQVIKRDRVPNNMVWVRYWDLAVSEGTSGDYTSSIKGAFDGAGNMYFDGEVRGRWEWGDVRGAIKTTSLDEKYVLVGVESQGMQKGMIQEIWRDTDLMGVGIIPVPVSLNKEIRAFPLQARCDARKVYLVEGDWNDAFIQEHCSFPLGRYDDRVDASSGVMGMLGLSQGGVDSMEKYLHDEEATDELKDRMPGYTVPDFDTEEVVGGVYY